jgi:hypothetical protein
MLTPTVPTDHVPAAPHTPEGEALRAELELAAERLQAATQGLIDVGLLPPAPTGPADLWHRVAHRAHRVHRDLYGGDSDEPCQSCVDWTRAAMAEVQPELARLNADVRWLRKQKLQLNEATNRLTYELQATRSRLAAVRTVAAGLDGLASVLLNEGIADATPDQLGELAGRFTREHQALHAALDDDHEPAAEPAGTQAVLDVRVMRALTTQRDQAVNDLGQVVGERDRVVNELELMAVEINQLRNVNGLLEQALDHAGEVFRDAETGKYGWRCVLCEWVGRDLDSQLAAYQELGRHWSTVDHDGDAAREELTALQARVQELLGPIRTDLADAPASMALPLAAGMVGDV